MHPRPLLLLLACLLLTGAARAADTATTQQTASQKLQDTSELYNAKMEWDTFHYADKTITAQNVRILPDAGKDRINARDGHPTRPLLTIRQLKITLAKDPTPTTDLEPIDVQVDQPAIPPETASTTQPSGRDFLFLTSLRGIIGNMVNPEWTEVWTLKGVTDIHDTALPVESLRTLTIHDFRYELAPNPDDKDALQVIVLSVTASRQPDNTCAMSIEGATQTANKPLERDPPIHVSLKINGRQILARSPDAQTQPATAPARQK